jgi:putative FmdB family regulatory protein
MIAHVPVYEYRCPTCDTRFDVRRPMSEANTATQCPDGHDGAVRLLSVFAAVGTGDAGAPTPASAGAPCGPACACHGG